MFSEHIMETKVKDLTLRDIAEIAHVLGVKISIGFEGHDDDLTVPEEVPAPNFKVSEYE